MVKLLYLLTCCAGLQVELGVPSGAGGAPLEPNQFAMGLSDGAVQVLEPLEAEGAWGTAPPSARPARGQSGRARVEGAPA